MALGNNVGTGVTALLHVEHSRQQHIMQAFSAGLARHNIHGRLQKFSDGWPFDKQPDFVVVWGVRPHIPEQFKKTPKLILEAGYINGKGNDYVQNRLRFISTSWNKLHGEADSLKLCDHNRWRSLDIPIFAWRKPTNNVATVLMQHPSDAVAFDAQYPRVHRDLVREGWQVNMRPHPLVRKPDKSLQDEILESDICVTYCSTAAVESVLLGTPTITLSRKAIAWPVTSHSIGSSLYTGDRLRWCIDLANRQWTLDEFRNGDAWEILCA